MNVKGATNRAWVVLPILMSALISSICSHTRMDSEPEKFRLIEQLMVTPQPAGTLTPCEQWVRQVYDPHLASSTRVEAVGKLASECRDHKTLQVFQGILPNDREDLAVRTAIVRALPRWDDSFFPLTAVTRALSLPGLRLVAIDTLQKLGAVSGQRESRLLSEIATPKSGAAKHFAMAGMPGLYGRDPRLLEYLAKTLQTGNQWDRALAASELFGLGESATSLQAAADPEARVRKSLASAIGWFRDERGTEVLRQLLNDPDPRVAGQAADSLRQLGIGAEARSVPFRWRPLLEELSAFRLTDPLVTGTVPQERIRSRWLGEPGASDQQLQALEHKIGRPLPPGYRAFLSTSNGFLHQSSFIPRTYGAGEVEWFRVHHADWAAAYQEVYPDLGSCLQVSAVGDAAVVLLNPEVVRADGEWETWFFANWVPGARVYGSFREFMESEIENLGEWRNR